MLKCISWPIFLIQNFFTRRGLGPLFDGNVKKFNFGPRILGFKEEDEDHCGFATCQYTDCFLYYSNCGSGQGIKRYSTE